QHLSTTPRLAAPMMQQGQYLAPPTPSAAVGYAPMFSPQQMPPAYAFAPLTPEATPHPAKRRRQEQKPAEHKKPKKSAVSSRALELRKREMESYSVTVLFVLLASFQAQPAEPVVLSDDDDAGDKNVIPAETGASGKRYISLDFTLL